MQREEKKNEKKENKKVKSEIKKKIRFLKLVIRSEVSKSGVL